jgi:hypothetical protein
MCTGLLEVKANPLSGRSKKVIRETNIMFRICTMNSGPFKTFVLFHVIVSFINLALVLVYVYFIATNYNYLLKTRFMCLT